VNHGGERNGIELQPDDRRMEMNAFETAINNQVNGKLVKRSASFVGGNLDDVLKNLGQPPIDYEQVARDTLSRFKADLPAVEHLYWAAASLYGFIRGGISANVYFGSAGSYDFSGGMWTSPIAVGGGGMSSWSMTPSNGQGMDVVWAGASLEGGVVDIFWSISGVVMGAMTMVVAGVGLGGGKGSGTWTKV